MRFAGFLPLRHFAATCVLASSFMTPTATAQSSTTASTAGDAAEKSTATYVDQNGTQTITRTEDTERKKTADGEVEIQRFHSPSWSGDQSVAWEREVRTKKLADGTVEKEYVVKNPDGGNHLTPVQIIRERITPGKDSTTVQRETLVPDYEGHWQAVQKETIRENGVDVHKQVVRDVQQPDASGDWRVVERQVTSARSTAAGTTTSSVRQVPDASGRLADYERVEQKTTSRDGAQTHEVTLTRRDFSDSDARQFYLVEQTTTQSSKTASGGVVRNSVTKSDLLPNSPARNFDSNHAEVTQQRIETDRSLPGGAKQTEAEVSERTAGDPNSVRPVYNVIREKDRDGYVRQIFIPAQ